MSEEEQLVADQNASGPIDEAVDERKLTFFERWFGKMHPGGVRGSMFVLIATALGPGCLTLPMCMSQSGLIWGVLFMLIAAIMSIAALYALFLAAQNTKTSSYAQCATAKLGYRYGVTVQVILVVYTYGALVAYQVMIVKILSKFFAQAGMEGKFADETSFYAKLLNIIIACALFPLCIKRDLSSLNYIATVGVFAILYIIIMLFAQAGNYSKENWNRGKDSITYGKIDWSFPNSFCLCVFAFTCYTVVFQVSGELSRPTQKRVAKIILRAVGIETFIYLSLAVAAYVSLLDTMPDVILMRDKLDGHYSGDIAMQIARILMSIIIFFGLAININPAKQGIIILQKGLLKPYINDPEESEEDKQARLQALRQEPSTKQKSLITSSTEPTQDIMAVPQKYNIIITAIIQVLSCGLAIAYPEVKKYVGILAGYFGCTIGIAYPALLYIKIKREESHGQWNLGLYTIAVLGTIFSVMGYLGATIDLLMILGVKAY